MRQFDDPKPAKVVSGQGVSGSGSSRSLVQLQQAVGNRAVVAALSASRLPGSRLPASGGNVVVQRWPWSKKKSTTSAPKGGPTTTRQDRAEALGNTQPSALPLRDIVTRLLDAPQALVLSDLKAACDGASQGERDEVYADKQLLERIEQKLTSHQYIAVLGYLRVVEPPSTGSLEEANGRKGGHTSAKDADAIIQKKMQKYVAEAVKAGKQVSGQVAVVSDADFRKAYFDETWQDNPRVDSVNAFVRSSDRLIVIHHDRGNAGTTIHEGLHKYSNLELKSKAGFNVNEGVTEFFTRQICNSLPKRIARGNYEDQYEVVAKLKKLVGSDVLAKAYFSGAYDDLVAAFVKAGKTEEIWENFVQAMNNSDYKQAWKLLR